MDRSLSTIDTTVIHSLSLPPPVAPSSRSFSLSPLFYLSRYRHVSSFERRTKIQARKSSGKRARNFHGFDFSNARNCYSDGNVGYYETGGQSVRGLIMRYASRSFSILASPAYHGFHVAAPITEINTVGLDLIAVCARERDPLSSF